MTSYSVIEEKYQDLGLFDNRLNNLYDLFRAHNINVMEIPGFIDLDAANRELFSKFIINFYNMQGLCLASIKYIKRQKINPAPLYPLFPYCGVCESIALPTEN